MANELILIVDDNPKDLKLVRDTLQVKGYQTIEAETGEGWHLGAGAAIAPPIVDSPARLTEGAVQEISFSRV